ncbi:g5101 [Coccomyxa viridis]|uniref:G5101 protein n=1 Tax=Coccomyxa viridis TaxID=1274662 RepID=A0ABP1FRZ5_9CHLO
MAEIASSYPVAGGPYFWCLELTRNNKKYTLIAWITGWLNVLGQFATTGTLGYITVKHLGVMWMLANGHIFSNAETFLAYAICLLFAGLVSSVPAKRIQQFAVFAAIGLVFGGIIIMILLPLCAPKLQTASWVFSSFFAWEKEEQGIPSDAWLFLLGMLASQLVFIGFESPSQFAEETRKADRTVPQAIVWSIIACGVLGGGLVLVLLFCIQDPDNLLTGEAQGYAAAQIFYDVFKGRFGNGAGGIVLLGIPLLSFFNGTVISMGTNARMLWAFSRDRGVPLYKVWVVVSKRTATPLNATWAMTALAFFLGLPILFSPSTFLAMGSISFAGLYISYTVPMALRMVMGKEFPQGPFKLGVLQPVINAGAIIYMVVSVIVMLLPTQLPVDPNNMNYTCVTVGAVMILVIAAWYLPFWGAKHWYIPKRHLQQAALPKPAARTLRSKHLPPGSSRPSPSNSRSSSLIHVASVDSLPSVPSLESQASPPYPHHFARHPMARAGSEDSSELSVYQPRLQLPDIWKQPPQRPAPKKEDFSPKLPMLREAPGKGPTPPGA